MSGPPRRARRHSTRRSAAPRSSSAWTKPASQNAPMPHKPATKQYAKLRVQYLSHGTSIFCHLSVYSFEFMRQNRVQRCSVDRNCVHKESKSLKKVFKSRLNSKVLRKREKNTRKGTWDPGQQVTWVSILFQYKKVFAHNSIFCVFASVASILIGKDEGYEKKEKNRR